MDKFLQPVIKLQIARGHSRILQKCGHFCRICIVLCRSITFIIIISYYITIIVGGASYGIGNVAIKLSQKDTTGDIGISCTNWLQYFVVIFS